MWPWPGPVTWTPRRGPDGWWSLSPAPSRSREAASGCGPGAGERALTLAAAGERRFPLPPGTPESDGHRGHQHVYLGLALCLVAAGILADGLVEDLTSGGVGYDAVGQQRIGLVLLAAGTTFGGWGQLAHRAARRLYEEEQPALIVGVRAGADGRHWVCADARTRSAAP